VSIVRTGPYFILILSVRTDPVLLLDGAVSSELNELFQKKSSV